MNARTVLNLQPTDWRRVWWREVPPLPLPEARAYDWLDVHQRYEKIRKRRTSTPNYRVADLQLDMAHEEARFWLWSMSQSYLVAVQADKPPQLDVYLSWDELLERLNNVKYRHFVPPQIVIPMGILYPMERVVDWLLEWQSLPHIDMWAEYWLPYVTEAQRQTILGLVYAYALHDPNIAYSATSIQNGDQFRLYPTQLMLSYAGATEKMLDLVERWPDDLFVGKKRLMKGGVGNRAQELVLSLPTREHVVQHMKRLLLPLNRPQEARLWLAHTECNELDYLRDSILAQKTTSKATSLLTVLSSIDSSAITPHIIDIYVDGLPTKDAQKWLENHLDLALPQLLQEVNGVSKRGKQIKQFLQMQLRGVNRATIEAQLDDEMRDKLIDRTVLLDVPLLTLELAPDWLLEADATLKKAKGTSLPDWLTPDRLPPLTIDKRQLLPMHITTILRALKLSAVDKPYPLIEKLKSHSDPYLLDQLVWEVNQLWQTQGSPGQYRFVISFIYILGSDALIHKFTPTILKWVKTRQEKRRYRERVMVAVDSLALLATNTAYAELESMRPTFAKYQVYRYMIDDAVERIANRRELSIAELGDYAVPTCGLTSDGETTFDYGHRSFTFMVSSDLAPMVVDDSGKQRKTLPKPGKRDDASRADAAYQRWQSIRKQIKQVGKLQALRFEQAMIDERRWRYAQFNDVILHHPLLRHMARALVWGIFDEQQRVQSTFRPMLDGRLLDVHDEPLQPELTDAIGLVHPLHLDDETRQAWQNVLHDFEIIPSFAQLGRPVFTLPEQLEDDVDLAQSVDEIEFVMKMGANALIELGYSYAYNDQYLRYFPKHNISVMLYIMESLLNPSNSPFRTNYRLVTCFFGYGKIDRSEINSQENFIALHEVPPLIISEILYDLTHRL